MPPVWRRRLAAYRWERQSAGLSGADLFRLEARGKPSLFVKVEEATPFSEVQAEALRLPWLGERGIACPTCLDFQAYESRNWLLTSALPGRDAASLPEVAPDAIIRIVADALGDLHARPIEDCPFNQRLATRIARVRLRIGSGAIDEEDFAEEGGPASALTALLSEAPESEDIVLAHGDATLANFLVEGEKFTGFVDCGRFGLADRYQDLALACDSIGEFLGEAWVGAFLAYYGLADPDPRRLAFYERFDAFF